MRSHVQILAWIFIVLNAFTLLMGVLGLLAFMGLGIFAGIGGAFEALPIVGGLGVFLFLVVLALSLPGLLAGIGLLTYAPWSRILAIVLSILHLFNFPVGTALAVYGLYVLFNPETSHLFGGPRI